MRVLCTGFPPLHDGAEAGSSPWLTLDREYVVLGVLAAPGSRIQLHLLTDDGQSFGWFGSECFLTVDPRIPANWSSRIGDDGTFELGPHDWLADGFWESYYDGDPNAQESVARELTITLGSAWT